MANITCNTYRRLDSGFDAELQHAKLVYDFAEDTGGTSDTFRMGQVDGKILIVLGCLHVETAFTSAGSATIDLGAETADPNAFGATVAKATLVDDYVVKTAAGQILVVDGASATDYISLSVNTAALTAGKLDLFLSYYNVA